MFKSQNLSKSLWFVTKMIARNCQTGLVTHLFPLAVLSNMTATCGYLNLKLALNKIKKFSSQVHQPHFKYYNATCGEWPPWQPGQTEDIPIIAEFDWTALLQSITLCESIPTDHNIHNNCHLHLVQSRSNFHPFHLFCSSSLSFPGCFCLALRLMCKSISPTVSSSKPMGSYPVEHALTT